MNNPRIYLGVLLSLSVFCSLATEADTKPKTVITLPETFSVPNRETIEIRLGDLADSIVAADLESQEKYENLVVMKAPEPGQKSRLPNHYIIQAIRKADLDFFNLDWKGSRTVDVLGYGQEIKIKDLFTKLTGQVLERTGWKRDELILRIISAPPEDLWMPPGETEIDIEHVSPTYLGDVRFHVRFFADHVMLKEFPIVTSISHKRKAYAPVRNMRRGELITKDDIREANVYFDKQMLDEQTVDKLEDIVGLRCKTAMRRGNFIKWNALDINYVTNRGDLVQMVVRSGGLTLQTSGKAMKRGATGDVIPVKIIGTGKLVKAQIIQRGLVKLISL